MSQTTCPSGHVSADPEWCDTCGVRLGPAPNTGAAGGGAPAGNTAAPFAGPPSGLLVPVPDAVPCPHCGAANVSDALFCEDCGYDFTTGQAPEPVPTGTLTAVSGPASTPASIPASTEPRAAAAAPADVGGADLVPPDAATAAPTGWIVIVEVDPTWFSMKGTLADSPCPSPSTSTIPLGQAMVHIGRSSQSRGIRPEIAMDSDTAVSRRHAQLIATVGAGTSGPSENTAGGAGEATGAGAADGNGGTETSAFAVIDLGSTNGTFVVPADSEPTESIEPIAPGVPVTLADGDRVYIGAWSRLTIRHTGG